MLSTVRAPLIGFTISRERRFAHLQSSGIEDRRLSAGTGWSNKALLFI